MFCDTRMFYDTIPPCPMTQHPFWKSWSKHQLVYPIGKLGDHKVDLG